MESRDRHARRTDTFGVHHLTVVPENFEQSAVSGESDEGDRSAEPDSN